MEPSGTRFFSQIDDDRQLVDPHLGTEKEPWATTFIRAEIIWEMAIQSVVSPAWTSHHQNLQLPGWTTPS
jgi:hypothetical protein